MNDEIDRTEDGIRHLKRTDNEDMMTWWIVGNGRFALQFSLMRLPFSHLASRDADLLRAAFHENLRDDALPDFGMHFHPSLAEADDHLSDCELMDGGRCHFSASLPHGEAIIEEVSRTLMEHDLFDRDRAIFHVLQREFDKTWPLPQVQDG